MIHGCVDGFSRVITYLHCSTNNKAAGLERVLQMYGISLQDLTNEDGINDSATEISLTLEQQNTLHTSTEHLTASDQFQAWNSAIGEFNRKL